MLNLVHTAIHQHKYCTLQMLRPCPLSISCRAGRSEGDKAAISRSTVATQPRGGESSQGKYFSAKKYIFTQNQNSRVFHITERPFQSDDDDGSERLRPRIVRCWHHWWAETQHSVAVSQILGPSGRCIRMIPVIIIIVSITCQLLKTINSASSYLGCHWSEQKCRYSIVQVLCII